jgi:polar amino acid transport system substrate-binding protein
MNMIYFSNALCILLFPGAKAKGKNMRDSDILNDLAPRGRIRAAINVGNSVLAQRSGDSAKGLSADLAHELARRLGLEIELVIFDAAGKVFQSLQEDRWDVAFLAVEPARAIEIDFTEPYVKIDGVFATARDSTIQSTADVDAKGHRISVARGSGYDLYLTRTIKHAELIRWDNGDTAMTRFITDKLEVCANIRPMLIEFLRETPDYQILSPGFMSVGQAMATPKGRKAGFRYVSNFIRELKATPFILESLRRSGQSETYAA